MTVYHESHVYVIMTKETSVYTSSFAISRVCIQLWTNKNVYI